jgi:hypothetical protein
VVPQHRWACGRCRAVHLVSDVSNNENPIFVPWTRDAGAALRAFGNLVVTSTHRWLNANVRFIKGILNVGEASAVLNDPLNSYLASLSMPQLHKFSPTSRCVTRYSLPAAPRFRICSKRLRNLAHCSTGRNSGHALASDPDNRTANGQLRRTSEHFSIPSQHISRQHLSLNFPRIAVLHCFSEDFRVSCSW